ncbi:unnamed protein product, partial [Heterotrigona itama]
FLDALKMKYNNDFQAELTCSKLKVMFTRQTVFMDFKNGCPQENAFTANLEKIVTVVLKGLFLEQENARI